MKENVRTDDHENSDEKADQKTNEQIATTTNEQNRQFLEQLSIKKNRLQQSNK